MDVIGGERVRTRAHCAGTTFGTRRLESAADVAPDAELLRRFAATGDQEAFELLVWRHGALVLNLCRRQIGDEHLAEDAFQAVFLVLARKARSVLGGNVAGWLYRVARRVSSRAARNRQRLREMSALEEAAPETITTERDELAEVLDVEVARLPDRLRRPILLCYLGGRSTEDAARELGCPTGTLLSRLAAARKRLAERLGRRGIVLPAALTIGSLEINGQLVSATTVAALRFRRVWSSVDPSTVLAQEVIRTMTYTKIIWLFGLVLTAGFVGSVAWATTGGVTPGNQARNEGAAAAASGPDAVPVPGRRDDGFVRAGQPGPDNEVLEELLKLLKVNPDTALLGAQELQTELDDRLKLNQTLLTALKPDPNDPPLRQLQKALCREQAAAVIKMETRRHMGKAEVSDFHRLYNVSALLLLNLMELMNTPAEKLRCLELRVNTYKGLERIISQRVEIGAEMSLELNLVVADRIKAEIEVLKFKDELAKAKK